MSIWKAIMLGLVEGLTEFLPISRSGHMMLVEHLLYGKPSVAPWLELMLHVGALFAVCFAFWSDLVHLLQEGFRMLAELFMNPGSMIRRKPDDPSKHRTHHHIIKNSYRKLFLLLLISFIVTVAAELLLEHLELNDALPVAGCCLLITALFLLLAELSQAGQKKPRETSWLDAFWIGLTEGIAMLPGMSQTGAGMTTALLLDFDRRFAVKYAFLLSVPVLTKTVIQDLIAVVGNSPAGIHWGVGLTAAVTAAIFGYLAIYWMVKWIEGRPFRYFAIYCALLGIVTLVFRV